MAKKSKSKKTKTKPKTKRKIKASGLYAGTAPTSTTSEPTKPK